ncbi:MAG: DUF1569 domain-containing protein [Candidatus Sumerlaeota bacterium]
MSRFPRRLTRQSRDAYVEAVQRVDANTQPLWGKMTAHRMLAHLRLALEAAEKDEQPTEPLEGSVLKRRLMRFFFFDLPTPWPKGKIKVPDRLTPPPEHAFEMERDLVVAAIDRFLDLAEAEPNRTVRHPVLGDMTLDYWRRIHARHMQHHLKQFGAI